MPRIRKKTSNRQNTRDRKKIKKHVAEHKKKTNKAAKKDVTWKSKKKADPGVPNSFVHKDKVLAEMAAEKRAVEEEKLARRAAQKAGAHTGPDEPEDDTPGIQSILSANVIGRTKATAAAADEEEEDEDVEVPDLIDTSLSTLQEALDKADVVVEVVDARDIAGGRSKFIEELVKEAGGHVIVLVNKIDKVPRETLQSWLSQVPLPTFLFKSILPTAPSTSQGIDHTTVLGKQELLEYLSTITPSTEGEDLSIALMGLPNVGKTSVLNSLLPAKAKHHATAPVIALNAASKNPQPTTKLPSESRIEVNGRGIRVIDTPGWDFADDDDEEEEDEDEELDEEQMKKLDELEARMTGDLLRRNLGRVDRIKDVVSLADYIVIRSNAQDLMLAYNVPFFKEGDTQAFLTAVARATGRLRKGNQPDLESAARHVVRDWAQNTFPYYSAPKAGSSSMEVETAGQPDMSAILEKCLPRKEMRKIGKGVIRYKGGEVDEREVILDDDYTEALAPSDDEDDEEDDDLELEGLDSDEEVLEGADFDVESGSDEEEGDEAEVDDEDEDEEEEQEEEDEEEEEEEIPSPPRKNKRKAESTVSPNKKKARTQSINKRVSFGGKLGATGSSSSLGETTAAAQEVKGILKRDRDGNAKKGAAAAPTAVSAVSKSKSAKSAANGSATVTKTEVNGKSNGKGKGKGKGGKKVEGAYDFSAHFG